MNDRIKDQSHTDFDHNQAWQSTRTASRYDDRRFKSFGGRLYDRMEKRCIDALLEVAEATMPIKTALDLPCGTGRITELLLRRGYRLTCGDISQEMIDVARDKLSAYSENIEAYALLDVYNTDLPSSSYDCVSCIRLFQHLRSEERARALRELARISRRFVLVNVMYTSVYYGAVRRLRQVLGRYTTRYTSTRQEIEAELEVSGLRVVQSRFTQPGFNGDYVLLLEKV